MLNILGGAMDLLRVGAPHDPSSDLGPAIDADTGPKAGGPLHLARLCAESSVSTNTAAAGGDVELVAGGVFGSH